HRLRPEFPRGGRAPQPCIDAPRRGSYILTSRRVSPSEGGMEIEMNVKGLMIDPITNMPIIILRDREGQKILPIWVGVFEANAIALQIENVQTPRPMTHDLLKNVLQDLHAEVARVVVTALRENTFYASIHLRTGASEVVIDAPPSDPLALALRTHSPIYAAGEA